MQSELNSKIRNLYHTIVGKNLMIFSLMLLSIGLPLSKFLVGFSQFLLLLNWLLEGGFAYKWDQLKTNKIIWAFLLLPFIHVVWFINTTDFAYGLHDFKIKLPLLVFPLLVGTSKPLSKKSLELILLIFVLAVFTASLITLSIITGIYDYPHTNIREASIFISHIRFGLMVLFSTAIVGYFVYQNYLAQKTKRVVGFFLLGFWLFIFLIILQSLTSWVILFFLVIFLFFFYYKQIKWHYLRLASWVGLFLIIVGTFALVGAVYYNFYFTRNTKFSELPSHTPRGNLYLNDTLSRTKENGHYVKVLISYKELAETWPKVSQIPFNGKDAKGYPIWTTMVRYLASKGLSKDRDGVLALNKEDVKMIENGNASCVYKMKFVPYVKVYEMVWELDRYTKSGDANNKSVAQRIEYWKAAAFIIKNNFWVGVGTGDVKQAFGDAYHQLNSKLKTENRLRAHNQFITLFLTFGIIGFLLALFSMFYPAYLLSQKQGFFLVSFLFILFVSMINEDTLETQAGVTFYIFFYSLFTFANFQNHD